MKIDITGNWKWADAPEKGIITSQPEPPKTGNLFSQSLFLPEGEYRLTILYKEECDHLPGKAYFHREAFFPIEINGQRYGIIFRRMLEKKDYEASVRFMHTGGELILSAYVQDTFFFNSTIIETPDDLKCGGYYALSTKKEGIVTVVRGVPFYSAPESEKIEMWGGYRWLSTPKPRWQMSDWTDEIKTGDISVDTLYCLGMTHCYDIANGSWYMPTGDYGLHHFIGDRLGTLRLSFADGEEDVPLIMGFNVWYGMPWDLLWDQQFRWGPYPDMREDDALLFKGDKSERETVYNTVGLDDGIRRMGEETNQRYIFTLNLGGRRLRSVRVLPETDKYGIVTISGITVKTNDDAPLQKLPDIASSASRLTEHSLEDIKKESYKEDIEKLKRVLYTFTDELPHLTEAVRPKEYIGPYYELGDTQDAYLAATYLYHNGPECAAHIGDEGMDCASQTARWRITPYMTGTGVIAPTQTAKPYSGIDDFLIKYKTRNAGEFPGARQAWSRGIGELLREAMAFGYDKCIRNYLDWLDHALLNYANPPHWNRAVGDFEPEGYTVRMVGDTKEIGNRENDGHGICMWGRAMMWHWLGRDKKWNEEHWEATKAACDWIKWQLDVDEIFPGVRKDVLYTESECAHGDYDVYSTGNCLHGLRLSVNMAKQLGKDKEAKEWEGLIKRLADGMRKHLIQKSDFGDIWHTEEKCDWQDHVHKMVHLQLATEGMTYTPLEDYKEGFDRDFLEIDKNSYRYIMRNNTYNFLRMYGYGQGLATQSALLLDEMADAEELLHLMVTHNYLPKMEGFIAPEGIITHPSGEFYLPVNGYMGQDSHLADSTKAVRLLLGIDDNRPTKLHLIPRFPESWKSIKIEDYPVLLLEKRGKISYSIDRKYGYKMEIFLSEKTDLSVRVGPFLEKPFDTALVNGEKTRLEVIKSGDSYWGWIRGLSGDKFIIEGVK